MLAIKLQLYSEKCTGRYFKVRHDYLSSKQGIVIMYIQNFSKIFLSIYIFTYILYNFNKILVFFCVNSIEDRLMRPLLRQLLDRYWIDTSEYYVAPELEGFGTLF